MVTLGLANKIRCVQQFLITCNERMASVIQELKNVGRMTYFFQIWLVLLFHNKLSQSETEKSLFFMTKSDDIRYCFCKSLFYWGTLIIPYNFPVGWSGSGRHRDNEEICHDQETWDATRIPVSNRGGVSQIHHPKGLRKGLCREAQQAAWSQ